MEESLFGKETEGLLLTIDGATRGNPGAGAVGIVIEEVNKGCVGTVEEAMEVIGIATNNIAEYKALLLGLKMAKDHYKGGKITILTDSQLLKRQVCGEYQTRNLKLRGLLSQVRESLRHFEGWQILHIPRERNRRAHRLAQKAFRKIAS